MRDEQANEVYCPLNSTVVLKRKQKMFHMTPLDFENNATVDALVDSRAYVGAIAQNDLDTKKTKSFEKYPQNQRSS